MGRKGGSKMRKFMTFIIVAALAAPAWAQHPHFSLHLEALVPAHLAPVVESRRAEWNAPLGRVREQLAELQGSLGSGGMPHRATQGLIGLKAQKGTSLHLVTSVLESGIQVSRSSIAVVHWPWGKPAQEGSSAPVLPLDRQLSILLGRRLTRRPGTSH